MATPRQIQRRLKIAAHVLLSLPLLWIMGQWGAALMGAPHSLGVNVIETTIRFLGDWAIRALLVALAVSPVAWLSGWKPLMAIRRLTGLWAFAYTLLHFFSYFGMEQIFSLGLLWQDVLKRKYITFGMTALALLIPLAVTSTNGWVRRLGGRRWQLLHRSVYVIGGLAVLHHWFMVKGIQLTPIIHGVILIALLGVRFARWAGRRRKRLALA